MVPELWAEEWWGYLGKDGGGRKPHYREGLAGASAGGGGGLCTGPAGWGWRPGQESEHAGTFLEEYRPKLYMHASKKLGSGRRKNFPPNSSPLASFRSREGFMSWTLPGYRIQITAPEIHTLPCPGSSRWYICQTRFQIAPLPGYRGLMEKTWGRFVK